MPNKSAIGRSYGWKPQLPDFRDLKYTQTVTGPIVTTTLFEKFNIPPVYDQGQLGSCTGNDGAGILQFALMNKSTSPNPTAALYYPSRLFIYYNARIPEGTTDQDAGATIKDMIKGLKTYGACSENILPYDISKFANKPSEKAYTQAINFEIESYQAIDNTKRKCIVAAIAEGHPVAFGFTVYESFESAQVARTGVVPMPGRNEEVLGGHAVSIFGYNAEGNYYICRNSWGKAWGINGYFHMPAAYIENPNLCSDFWIINFKKQP